MGEPCDKKRTGSERPGVERVAATGFRVVFMAPLNPLMLRCSFNRLEAKWEMA
jgi:hypothetical protein